STERKSRVHLPRAHRRYRARNRRDRDQHQGCRRERERVVHGHARRERRDPAPDQEERQQPGGDAYSGKAESAREDAGNDLDALSPDGETDADLAPLERDEIREQPVRADGGERERDEPEALQQDHLEPRRVQLAPDPFGHGAYGADADVAVHLAHTSANLRRERG